MDQNGYQYQIPIKWGKVIAWLVFFFPLGLYFLVQEYRMKRNLSENGKMFKTTGIVLGCVGLFYLCSSPLIFSTTSEGVVLTTAEKFGYGFMMLVVFGSIGFVFFYNGIKKLKMAGSFEQINEQLRIQQNEQQYETEHPLMQIACPSCGATIQIRKGVASQCDYCGNVIK